MKNDKEKIEYESLEQYDFPLNEDHIIFKKERKYAKEIGELMIYFSHLESALNIMIAESVSDRSHDLGYLIIKSLRYSDKVRLGKDLYTSRMKMIQPDKTRFRLIKEFNLIFIGLERMGEFRNKVAHANWMSLDKKGNVRTKISKNEFGFIQFMKVKITPEIIAINANRCRQLTDRIYRFPNKVFNNI